MRSFLCLPFILGFVSVASATTIASLKSTASSTSSAIATTTAVQQDYFNVTRAWFMNAGGSTSHSNLNAEILDSITGNSTTCTIVQSDRNKAIPGNWHKCDDPTFSMKIDYFAGATWTLEFKHQYRLNGQKCISLVGPKCTTARALVSYKAGVTPGYQLSAGAYTTTDSYIETVVAPVFVRCAGGCGIGSGAY